MVEYDTSTFGRAGRRSREALAEPEPARDLPTRRRARMGKIVVTEFVSLDGVMEDPGGSGSFSHGGWTFEIDRGTTRVF
jgi:hypothetical protein